MVEREVVAGCDGSFGPSRDHVRWSRRRLGKGLPVSWLGILADVAPVDRRADLRLAPRRVRAALDAVRVGVPVLPPGAERHRTGEWSDDRIWAALAARLGHGQDGWELDHRADHREERAADAQSFVQAPMRHGRLFLAGDAAHIVPPTGAKGLNLAVADVALLAPALAALMRKEDTGSPTATPNARCAESGGAPTSPGG